jgi:protein TonB
MNRRAYLIGALAVSCAAHVLGVVGVVQFAASRRSVAVVFRPGEGEGVVTLTVFPTVAPAPAAAPLPIAPPPPVQAPPPVEVVQAPPPAPPVASAPTPAAAQAAAPPPAPDLAVAPAVEGVPAAANAASVPSAPDAPVVGQAVPAGGAAGDDSAPGIAGEIAADYSADIRPVYPTSARLRGEEGAVKVLALVNSAGRAAAVEVRESSGYPALDRAATDAICRARFRVQSAAGEPRRVLLTFRFRLIDR